MVFRRIMISVWGAVAGLGCVSAQPVLQPVSGDEVTLFVHGYKGAILQTAEGEIAWLTPGQAFSRGEKSLALPFEGQGDAPRFGPLTVQGPMTKLTVIPAIFEETLYLPFLEYGRDHLPGFSVFAYDWRQDNRETAARLCERIESLGPNRRVRIVAHSMGGLVTLQCLRHGPEAVRSMVTHVVFVGTPFKGAAGPWDDMFLGNTTARNRALLSADALLTFPSVWQLMPAVADFFVNEQRAPTAVDAFSSEAWLAKGWGVFADEAVRANPAYQAQLVARFEAHREFWRGLADEEGEAPSWKAMVVIGSGRQTTAGYVVKADASFDFSQSVTADGDGTVLTARAEPPKPIRAARVETTAEHAVMLNNAGVQEAIRAFVTK